MNEAEAHLAQAHALGSVKTDHGGPRPSLGSTQLSVRALGAIKTPLGRMAVVSNVRRGTFGGWTPVPIDGGRAILGRATETEMRAAAPGGGFVVASTAAEAVELGCWVFANIEEATFAVEVSK